MADEIVAPGLNVDALQTYQDLLAQAQQAPDPHLWRGMIQGADQASAAGKLRQRLRDISAANQLKALMTSGEANFSTADPYAKE